MVTQFVTGLVTLEDSYEAGREVASQIWAKLQPLGLPNLAIVFCSIRYSFEAVKRGIYSVVGEVPIIGCTSAGQFTDQGSSKEGLVCGMIASDQYRFYTGVGQGLKKDPIHAIKYATNSLNGKSEEFPHESAILFVDGLAGKGEEAVLAASSILGPQVKFAGGAAADNLAFKQTRVFGQQQELTDAVSLCFVQSRQPVVIAVKHGHKPISEPLRITKAKDNILYEIEGRPALDVWKDCVRERVKAEGVDIDTLSCQDLSKWLLKYEAGLMTGAEYKIRFPASCNSDGSLNFVCTMMEGAVIKIMDSERKDQIQSVREAVQKALDATQGMDVAGGIVFDCACRAMILEEEFSKALSECKEMIGGFPFIGCETYGEIAMEVGQLSGFHNTTTVIMIFPS